MPKVLSARTLPREKGKFILPEGAVYVGRPSRWGNPFALNTYDRATVLRKFREWVFAPEQFALREAARQELKGKDLVCWCHPLDCHADIWLVIANGHEGRASSTVGVVAGASEANATSRGVGGGPQRESLGGRILRTWTPAVPEPAPKGSGDAKPEAQKKG